MQTVTDSTWKYTNSMAIRGVEFGVVLKSIREELDSNHDDATKLHLIGMTMDLHKKAIDDFISKREPK